MQTCRRLCLFAACLLLAPLAPAAAQPAGGKDALGDPLPHGALLRLGTLRWRTDGHIYAAAFLQGGRTLVTASSGNHLQFWDAADGRELHELRRPGICASNFAVDRAGKRLAFGGNREVELIDGATGKTLRKFSGLAERALTVALSPDGRLVAASNFNDTHIWEADSGKLLHRVAEHTLPRAASAFAPDGKTLVLLPRPDRKGLILLDTVTGQPARTLDEPGAKRPATAAMAPDGKTAAVGFPDSPQVALWDIAAGKIVRRIDTREQGTYELAFSADGKLLASLAPDGLRLSVWDVASGERRLHTTAGPFALAPDGKSVAVSRGDCTLGRIDIATGKDMTRRLGHRQPVIALAFSPDGKTLATSAAEPAVRLWDATTGELRATLEGTAPKRPLAFAGSGSVAFSPDGKLLAVGGDRAAVWDVTARKRLAEVELPAAFTGGSRCVAFAEGGKTLVLDRSIPGRTGAGLDGRYEVWVRDADGKTERTQGAQALSVSAAAFTADGAFQAWAGWEGKVKIWATDGSAGTWEVLGKQQGGTSGLAFSADGRLLACAGGEEIVVWEWKDGRRLMTLKGSGKSFSRVAFCPAGRFLAEATAEGRVRVWELLTGTAVHTHPAHGQMVWALAFSSDGIRLATGGQDATAVIWDKFALLGRPEKADPAGKPDRATLWEEAGGGDADKAYRALWTLSADPRRAAAEARERVKPVPPARIKELVAALDSKRFADREAAQRALEKFGREIEPLVRTASDAPTEEARRRLRGLIERVAKASFTSDTLRAVRAVDMLEALGTAEARAALEALAAGARGSMRTEAARTALARLRKGSP